MIEEQRRWQEEQDRARIAREDQRDERLSIRENRRDRRQVVALRLAALALIANPILTCLLKWLFP